LEASSFARFHFRRHFFQHLGFRLMVDNESERKEVANIQATKAFVDQQITFHYGDLSEFGGEGSGIRPLALIPFGPDSFKSFVSSLPNLNKEVARICLSHSSSPVLSALDIGSEAGRLSFELARSAQRVVGLSFEPELFRLSMILKRHGKREYLRAEEGEVTETALAKLPTEIDRSRVTFLQTTEKELGHIITIKTNTQEKEKSPLIQEGATTTTPSFNIIVANNILDKLSNPRANLLDKIIDPKNEIIRPGSLFVVVSSFDWNKNISPKNNWIGGFRLNGENVFSTHMLKCLLKKEFEFVGEEEVPVAQRFNRRNIDVRFTSVTVFRKRL